MTRNSTRPAGERFDIHQHITDQLVAMIEAGAGDFKMPWHMSAGDITRPENVDTAKPYQGINILALWIACHLHGYTSPIWGTFKQWQAKGLCVRKGEKATMGVIYKESLRENPDAGDGEDAEQKLVFARAFPLFNADQIDGYTPPLIDPYGPSTITPIEEAERFITATQAVFIHEGERAFYRPATDTITMPPKEKFIGTATSTPTEAYYGTKLHEIIHWTGAKHRLDRDLANRFGSDAYAMEELIAELGAAYLCADLDITNSPRLDHAQYLATWLKVLKGDKKAIFTAAGKAQAAARFAHECGWVREARAMMEARIAEREAAEPKPTAPHPSDDLPLFAPPARGPR